MNETNGGKREITRIEWGVIASLLISAATAIFSGGVVYGQVQAQAARQDKLEARMDARDDKFNTMATDIASMKVQVEFLAQRARDDQQPRMTGADRR